jgi:hypothetical protein
MDEYRWPSPREGRPEGCPPSFEQPRNRLDGDLRLLPHFRFSGLPPTAAQRDPL